LKQRDIAIPRPDHIIHCGSGTYTHAIVASVEPFILVSEHGDMLWQGEEEYDFYYIGECHPRVWKAVKKRIKRTEGIKK